MLDSSIVSRDLFSVQALLVGIALHTLAGCGAGDGVATERGQPPLTAAALASFDAVINAPTEVGGYPTVFSTAGASEPMYSAVELLAALKVANGRSPNADPDGPGPQVAPVASSTQISRLDANADGFVTFEDVRLILRSAISANRYGTAPGIGEVGALTKVMDYSNERKVGQVFNAEVVDINGDGLEDVLVAGWAIDSPGQSRSSLVPLKILIQGQDGLLIDKTDYYIKNGDNYIYGAQRIIVEDFDNDGKPDIFLGGFQDHGSAIPAPSVMFWNNGNSFYRVDFYEPVWAHAACAGDVFGLGRKDIVMGGSEIFRPYTIYKNMGGRKFELATSLENLSVSSGGACAVIRDEATGQVAIITTNMAAGSTHSGFVTTFDSKLNNLKTQYLPGSEEVDGWNLVHDLVNLIKIDLNNDGLIDVIMTDNGNYRLYRPVGRFVALLNQGGFVFTDKTNDYFNDQTGDYVFGYYSRMFEYKGIRNLFVGNAAAAASTFLWKFDGYKFEPHMSELIKSATNSERAYVAVYKTKSGAINLLMQKSERFGEFEFHTKRIQ